MKRQYIYLISAAVALTLAVGTFIYVQGVIGDMKVNETQTTGEDSKPARNYSFDGSISEEVLRNYLSRAVTHTGLLACHPEDSTWSFEDDLRMLKNIGAKFIGRAAFAWGTPPDTEEHFAQVKERAELVHKADPEIILQACLFEIVSKGVENIPIPEWVFKEFGVTPEQRNFDYEAMLYDDGRMKDMWGPGSSPPDMSKLETRMYFYYRGVRYIDSGIEAIHFGQHYLMNQNDPGLEHWSQMLGKLREYAKKNGRRHFLLCDAHEASGGVLKDGEFLFDFNSFPARPMEDTREPMKATLSKYYLDSVYMKTKKGTTPSGWFAEKLPYLIEIDNGGIGDNPGKPSLNSFLVWNYDEITWFALQPEEYRNEWLSYAWNWVRENTDHTYFQFPTRRMIMVRAKTGWKLGDQLIPQETSKRMGREAQVAGVEEVDGVKWVKYISSMYRANTPSPAVPNGFNQEETIKAIWANE